MVAAQGQLQLADLSRQVSHALRHEPWLYELELDAEGWVAVDELVSALRSLDTRWRTVDGETLKSMIAAWEKARHEIAGGRIRALYGHSLPGRLRKERGSPPEYLFHGTSPERWEQVISKAGLRPMGRQYVHLSVDPRMADQVGRRKSVRPVVLRIRAREADGAGVPFLIGNERVWLVDELPARFIDVLDG